MAEETSSRERFSGLLAEYVREHGREPRLGCSLVAHRDLGFCSACTADPAIEISAWRVLAMAERGIPSQPGEKVPMAEPSEAALLACRKWSFCWWQRVLGRTSRHSCRPAKARSDG